MNLIGDKISGEHTVQPETTGKKDPASNVTDLMAALQASIDRSKPAKAKKAAPKKKKTPAKKRKECIKKRPLTSGLIAALTHPGSSHLFGE
ncbi:hypothetical protein BsIDN1_32800 [Bacillus safensis]|uniref:Uncharacterized protein n=1 Tax=Bacillus safensis TaxID=561879 RepID=A0A5S9MAP5_BACIA|nr:hypothetical protein BsIDN1_32800 [Bacillus safensis]